MALKTLSLFSGIGCFDRGLESSGFFKTIAFCEIDKHCRKVLNKHWPSIPIFEDIHTLNGDIDIPHITRDYRPLKTNIDVICGSWPCVGHSTAGKKKGLNDEKSGLWKEYKRLIGEIRPKYVIAENSANLRTTGLAEVLEDLWSLKYNVEWSIISAYGIGSPHQRERIYIVAWREDISYPNPFRSWSSYNEETQTKQEWWTSVRFKRDSLFEQIGTVESPTIRIDDGSSTGLHKSIDERIKQLGNALLPQIPYLIGKQIGELEQRKNNGQIHTKI